MLAVDGFLQLLLEIVNSFSGSDGGMIVDGDGGDDSGREGFLSN